MKTIFALLALAAIADSAIAATPSQNADTAKQAAPASATAVKPAAVLPLGHPSANTARVDLGNIKVPKATGPDARTVAEVIVKRNQLNNKTVEVILNFISAE
jgi:hypothetical protein